MAQLATENWLSRQYGVTFNDYPIYKNIKFTNTPNVPAKNDTALYYLGVSCSTTNTGVTGAASNTLYLVNPTYTWISRVINTYNSQLYDVYILTDYSKLYSPTDWNPNMGVGYIVSTQIKKIMDIIFVKVGSSTPKISTMQDYYAIKNKVNIPINEYQSIYFGDLTTLLSNNNSITNGAAVNPASAKDPLTYFNNIGNKTISSTTYYYKLFLKRSNSLVNPDSASSVPVAEIRICQDERNILNVNKAGIYTNRYADGSLLGDNSGILTPYTENKNQVISNTKNTNIPGSLTSFFDNSFDSSLSENVCVTQDYFNNKIFNRIIYPSLYSIGPNTTSNNGVYCSGYITASGPANYEYFGASPIYSGEGSVKLFPPCISSIEYNLGHKISINLNKSIIQDRSSNLSYDEMNSTINSTTAFYGDIDTTHEDKFQLNNIVYTTNQSDIPQINYNTYTSGFVKSVFPLSYTYKHPLNNAAYEGLTIGYSNYIMTVSAGVSIYPLLTDPLTPYITPSISFPSLRKNPVYSSNYTVEFPSSDWNIDSNSLPVSQHNGVYTSLNTTDNSMATMTITINDLDKFILYIRSYGELNYDYVSVSNLDVSFNSVSDAQWDSSKVYAHTKGAATSGTSLSAYKKVIFDNIGGGHHTIEVVYRKDGSQSSNADKGYVIIPEEQEAYQNIHDLPAIPFHKIFHLPYSTFNTKVYHPTLHNMTYDNFRTFYDQSIPALTSVNGYLSTPTLVIPSSIVRTGSVKNTFTASAVRNTTNGCIDIKMTLPNELGPFKIRPFAYHSSPSNNMFLSHDCDEEVINSVLTTIDDQLSDSDQYDTIFADKVVKYKQSNSSTIYTATVHINHIGQYYNPEVTSTSGDLEITFRLSQSIQPTYNTTIKAETVSNFAGDNGTYLYFRTSTHFHYLLSDNISYRSTAITESKSIRVAY